MTAKDAIAFVEKGGTKLTKQKLLEAIQKSSDKDFSFAQDKNGDYAVVRVRLPS